ncbi:hypothetical protein CDEST_14413 [Colletotrichum destructivum]|uniref:Uncharacterized protein n=1 Tax=Colletotrichum destructivum TaxID=34406 RepID=A0AAX4J1G3_9PEZI|nr:hypothetical protein CDEST_14413 [Colletotrichum destructivum]
MENWKTLIANCRKTSEHSMEDKLRLTGILMQDVSLFDQYPVTTKRRYKRAQAHINQLRQLKDIGDTAYYLCLFGSSLTYLEANMDALEKDMEGFLKSASPDALSAFTDYARPIAEKHYSEYSESKKRKRADSELVSSKSPKVNYQNSLSARYFSTCLFSVEHCQ